MRRLIIGFMVLAAGCSSSEPVAEEPSSPDTTVPAPEPASEGGTPYTVPADANATYSLLSVKATKGRTIMAMTRRTGSSGTSYSNREIDCREQLARYIGEGSTREEAEKPAPNLGEMTTLVEGSSTHAAVQAACVAGSGSDGSDGIRRPGVLR